MEDALSKSEERAAGDFLYPQNTRGLQMLQVMLVPITSSRRAEVDDIESRDQNKSHYYCCNSLDHLAPNCLENRLRGKELSSPSLVSQ